jgi:hypothetical protein
VDRRFVWGCEREHGISCGNRVSCGGECYLGGGLTARGRFRQVRVVIHLPFFPLALFGLVRLSDATCQQHLVLKHPRLALSEKHLLQNVRNALRYRILDDEVGLSGCGMDIEVDRARVDLR